MKILKTDTYLRHEKKIVAKRLLLQEEIDNAIDLLISDIKSPKLQYKKIICKRDKNRHSFRVPNTQYRFLVTDLMATENTLYLIMLLDHNKYDRANKDC